jgi:ribonucleoside-diphosphate reductase alpha chain
LATILGTFQSTFTDYRYINKKWQKNSEEERLLGVSLTGIFDNPLTANFVNENALKDLLVSLKKRAILTNKEWAEKLGINQSVAVTTVKPSGTTSALCGTSSGIHPSHAPHYIRYVRNDKKDPLTQFMIFQGFPYEEDAYDPEHVVCFKFPLQAPSNGISKKYLKALDHLNIWLIYQKYFTEHSPSITVSVREEEWLEIGAWVYKNFEWMTGVSFLPMEEENTVYKQTPFTTCTQEDYEVLLACMPKNIDWTRLSEFEREDTTTMTQNLACTGDKCFI